MAALIGCGVSTTERMKAAGKLPPCIHVGGSKRLCRWERASVELWLAWGCPSQREFEAMKAAKK